jgi:hypothetical protein
MVAYDLIGLDTLFSPVFLVSRLGNVGLFA